MDFSIFSTKVCGKDRFSIRKKVLLKDFVPSRFYKVSIIFQSYHNSIWLQQVAQCSIPPPVNTDTVRPLVLTPPESTPMVKIFEGWKSSCQITGITKNPLKIIILCMKNKYSILSNACQLAWSLLVKPNKQVSLNRNMCNQFTARNDILTSRIITKVYINVQNKMTFAEKKIFNQ